MREIKPIYIYNPKQFSYYISNGVNPISNGVNKKTGKIYFVFNRNETEEVFQKWIQSK